MMSVGLDVSTLCTPTPTGIGRYTEHLARALVETGIDVRYFVKSSRKGREGAMHPDMKDAARYYVPRLPLIIRRPQVVHATDVYYPTVPGSGRVVTIHDLAIFREETRHIEGYTSDVFRERGARKLKALLSWADGICVPSRATASDLVEMFGVDESRITVTPLGCDHIDPVRSDRDATVLDTFGLEAGRYSLFIGHVSIRKNLQAMIEAMKRTRHAAHHPFVVAGADSMGSERIHEAARGTKTIFTGYRTEEETQALLRNAACLVFATYYEGFGIPVLEAMRCGVPVVAGSYGAAREAGGSHAVYADPFDIDSIAAAIDEAWSLPDTGRDEGRRHADAYIWKNTASRTIDAYRRALER